MPLSAAQTFDREFLTIRAKILEIAACLDRLDRADGDVGGDARLGRIHAAIQQLLSSDDGRAEAVQQTFSLPYDGNWRQRFGVAPVQ